MQENLKIFQKLLKIFTLVILKSLGVENQKYKKVKKKKFK